MTWVALPLRAVLAGLMLFWGAASASASGLAFINGQSYLQLSQWAAANGFSSSTHELGHEVVLTDANTRLVFDVNSAQMEINGIHVRLSFPVASQADRLYLSELDLKTVVRPLVDPPRSPAKNTLTICLDPGHGGRDTGNRVGSGFFAHNEKTYTLALALVLRQELENLGFNVILTRSRDVYVPLPARPALANARGADLFVSLHFNASQADPASVAGPETYCITPVGAKSSNDHSEDIDGHAAAGTSATVANYREDKSLVLAYQMEKALVQSLHAEDRSVRRARFAVLRDARMPAILIEGGYMTNPAEGRKINTPAYRQQMADAITRGILTYLRITEPGAFARVNHPLRPAPRLNHLADSDAGRSSQNAAQHN
jgi:N-acetylmuramoyl-L-alanine amidase